MEIVKRLRMNRSQDDQDTPMDREEEHLKDKVILSGNAGSNLVYGLTIRQPKRG